MKKTPEIRTILLDLGNVIVKVLPEKFEEALKPYCRRNVGKLKGYLTESKNVKRYQEGKSTSSEFYTSSKRFFKMRIKYGEFFDIWNSMFEPIEEMDGIIRSIKKKYPEIKVLLFSDTNESHYQFVSKEYDCLSVLDGYILSYEVGKQKPHQKMFKAALSLAGSIPKNTFYTDDRMDLIKKARVLGLCAFQFTTPGDFCKRLEKIGIKI